MKRSKRGQAVQEFIFTYGWVLLAVIAAFGAMVYFGIGRFDFLQREYCQFYSGINCLDFTYNGTHIILVLENELGFDIGDMNLSISGTCQDHYDTPDPEFGPVSLNNGRNGTYVFNCSYPSGYVQETLGLQYTLLETMTNHTKVGELVMKVQPPSFYVPVED